MSENSAKSIISKRTLDDHYKDILERERKRHHPEDQEEALAMSPKEQAIESLSWVIICQLSGYHGRALGDIGCKGCVNTVNGVIESLESSSRSISDLLDEISKENDQILSNLLQNDSEALHAVSWKQMTPAESKELEAYYRGLAEGYNHSWRKSNDVLQKKKQELEK